MSTNKAYKIIFIYLVFSFNLFGGEKYSIIPQPTKLIERDGSFIITNNTFIILNSKNNEINTLINNFINQINLASSLNLKKSDISKRENCITFRENPILKEEAYRLDITSSGINIEASTYSGFLYAIQTLYQLLPIEIYSRAGSKRERWELPNVFIEDAPLYAHRGVLLDVGRHFYPIGFIKQFIDLMSMYKLNKLQWHLTEDQGWRIEIKKYPLLTEIGSVRKETMVGRNINTFDSTPHGGFYTQDEAKEIVRYAAERGITIIPEIELPGHSLAAIASYPELSCGLEQKYEVATTWGVIPHVYCPKESTFEFLEDVFTELFDIFPSEYYHIGGDECPKESWKKCKHCQHLIEKEGLKDENGLQSYFVRRIEQFLNANGKKIVGWDEILEGGLAPNASVTVRNGDKIIKEVANSNHNVIVTYAYLDYAQEHELNTEDITIPGGFLSLEQTYKQNIIPKDLESDKKKFIMGVQACVWTEYIQNEERLLRQVFPRLFAFSEVAWGTSKESKYDQMRKKVVRAESQLQQMNIKISDSFYNPLFEFDKWWVSEYPKELKLSLGYPFGRIYYTKDGNNPTAESYLYTAPIQVNKNETIRAGAFKNGKLLGKVRTINFK